MSPGQTPPHALDRAFRLLAEGRADDDGARLAEAAWLLSQAPQSPEIARARAEAEWLLSRFTGDRARMTGAAEAFLALAPECRAAINTVLVQADLDAGDIPAATRRLGRQGCPKGWRWSIGRRLPPEWDRSQPPKVRTERNGILLAGKRDWFLIRNDNALVIDGLVNANPAAGQYVLCTARNGLTALCTPRPQLDFGRAPHVLIGSSGNYYHWLFDHLPRVAQARRHPELADLPLVVGAHLARFERETLGLLGIPDSQLVGLPDATAIRFGRLHIPDLGTVDRNPHPQTIAWLRETFLPQSPNTGRRLWLTRQDATLRRMVNEDEILAALVPLGFERLSLGDLSVPAQAAAFAEADIICGPHGAAFANLVFCRPGTAVVEIMPGRAGHLGFYPEIAAALGLRHLRLAAEPRPTPQQLATETVQNFDMAAAVGDVIAALGQVFPIARLPPESIWAPPIPAKGKAL
jgi:Glycosyltransferase 61